MKQRFAVNIVIVILLFSNSLTLCAQQYWAIAVIENGKTKPDIMEYHSVVETAGNGIDYYRIYDDSYKGRKEAYSPVRLQYGYRWTGKKMFIYDFESQHETLAFDFSLSKGDHFTTFNGMEWKIEAVKDTLVNISFCGQGVCVSKRLLTVSTLDDNLSDQWLEGFGSFAYHFMINSLENVKNSQTLWMEYGMGEYLARNISIGPIFGHDSGWLDGTYSDEPFTNNYANFYFENGLLIFENAQWWYEHREYSCLYQDGDCIYNIYNWELEPHIDGGALTLMKDVITFEGLPTPVNGNYTIYVKDNEYTTGISNVKSYTQPTSFLYDMQGRRLTTVPKHGVYIKDGKVWMK
jgi:hypothetical protein